MGAGVSLSLPRKGVLGANVFSSFFSLISIPFTRELVSICEGKFSGDFNLPDNEKLLVLFHITFLLRARVDLGRNGFSDGVSGGINMPESERCEGSTARYQQRGSPSTHKGMFVEGGFLRSSFLDVTTAGSELHKKGSYQASGAGAVSYVLVVGNASSVDANFGSSLRGGLTSRCIPSHKGVSPSIVKGEKHVLGLRLVPNLTVEIREVGRPADFLNIRRSVSVAVETDLALDQPVALKTDPLYMGSLPLLFGSSDPDPGVCEGKNGFFDYGGFNLPLLTHRSANGSRATASFGARHVLVFSGR